MTDLGQRYGSRSRIRTKSGVALVVLLAATGLSWLTWVVLEHGRPEVQSTMVSFRAEGEHATVARFTVIRRSADVEATCLLRAYSSDHTIVGELDLTVGPGGPSTATLEETVRTEREATSVEVVGCRTEGQKQRR